MGGLTRYPNMDKVADMQDLLSFVRSGLSARTTEWPDIARRAGVPYSTLCKVARAHTEDPRVSTVQRLADAMGGYPPCPCETKKAA